MLNQYAGVDLAKEPNRFDFVADRFENIPMFFQTYFGSTHVDDVTTMIDYAIYTHDVGHVVIDNLQFMLSGQGRGMERFDMQDDVVAKLRKMATTHNVHITLVIHPRKGEEGADLTVSSIFGTAKSTQEADNVIILQQREKYRLIDVKKNRHDGDIGRAALWFDRHSKRFEQTNAREIEQLMTGTSVEEILEKRSRTVNTDALVYQAFEQNDDMRVPKISHKPDSVVTDENMHRILARKNTPKEHRHFNKAFSKVDELNSALLRISQEEPDPRDRPNRITISPQQQNHANTSSMARSDPRILQEDPIDYDPFEIKYEGNYDTIGVTFKPEVERISVNTVKASNQSSTVKDHTPDVKKLAENVFEQPFSSSVLKGFSADEKIDTVENLTEGEVLFTYDEMVEEISGNRQKKFNKRTTSSTEGTIQYKRKSSKADNDFKNDK